MSPHTRKSTKSAKQKLSANTVISHPATSTNIDTNMNISAPVNSDLIPAIRNPKLPAIFAQLLRGHGASNSGHKPLFKGNHDVYYLFSVKLNNWIMIHDLEDFLNDDSDDDPVKNLCLFVLIIGCLDGDPLHLVSITAKGDGKRAIQLLDEKYPYNNRLMRVSQGISRE